MPEVRMSEGDYKTLAELEEAFEEKDLAHFISLLENSKGQPLCRVLREDPSPLTRHEAAFTLGQLGYRSAVPSLIDAMINDESPIVRHESAVALSSIGDDSAVAQLEKAIEDKDEDVSNSALIAFEYLSYLRRKRDASHEKTALKPKIRL
jgi:deoxyhypusine monooxygenase